MLVDFMPKSVTLNNIMKNPFAYGRVVEGVDYCPRPKLEKLLADMLASGQNVVLHGARRVGKTSLAMRAARKKRTVYADFLACNDAGEVTERIVKAAMKELGDAIRFEMIELMEPPKATVRGFKAGDPISRAARVKFFARVPSASGVSWFR